MIRSLIPFAVALALVAPLAAAQGADAAVRIDDQSSGGQTVVVATATLPEGGFLTIHDSTLVSEEDALGSVIGKSGLLPAGTHADVRIHLERDLVGPKETLVAMPHKDTNGNGLYDFVSSGGSADGPYAGGANAVDTFAGAIVIDTAEVQVTASLVAPRQLSSGTSVLVERVELSEGGFVAVHDSTLVSEEDALGSVVGVSPYLAKGAHTDVLVTFTREVSAGPVIPMPHKDSNGNREYDFVTSQGSQDPPYAGTTPTFAGNLTIAVTDLDLASEARATFDATSTGGNLLVVPEVFLPEAGFVALHDSTLLSAEDPFGSVVGVSAPLPAGLHREVVVPLRPVPGNDKAFDADGTIVVMPHKDSNSNGVYDFITSQGSADGPFVGGPDAMETFAGNIVVAAADVKLSALAIASDARSDGRTLRVAHVDLAEDGFLAVHDMTLLTKEDALGSVVGVSDFLAAGAHDDVTVTLTTPLAGSQTLVLMPHKDSNGNRAYDFVTSQGAQDPPFAGPTPTFAGELSVAVAQTTVQKASAPATPTNDGAPPPTGGSATPPPTGSAEDDAADDSMQETPGLGVLALAGAAAAVALLVRRRAA